jgi:hypothetical protein
MACGCMAAKSATTDLHPFQCAACCGNARVWVCIEQPLCTGLQSVMVLLQGRHSQGGHESSIRRAALFGHSCDKAAGARSPLRASTFRLCMCGPPSEAATVDAAVQQWPSCHGVAQLHHFGHISFWPNLRQQQMCGLQLSLLGLSRRLRLLCAAVAAS